ncbi:MAG: hypothetical protein KBA33_02390 [Cloacibacterium sp.]|nr:hypothetical protein [Cloacibacterium sp.]
MTVEFENQQVSEYLLKKNLPLDLLYEIKDHMISQIYHLQNEEGLSFEEAFEKTKISWQSELKMVSTGWFTKREIPILYKRILGKNQIEMHKKAFFLSGVFVFILLGFSHIFSKEVFIDIYGVLASVLAGSAIINNIYYWRIIKSTFKKYNRKTSIYQKSAYDMHIAPIMIILLIMDYENKAEKLYILFNEGNFGEYFTHTASFLIIYTYIAYLVYGFLNFTQYRKALDQYKISV